PRAIWGGFVPDRGKPEHVPRVARAQSTNDYVVARGGVLDGDEMVADPALVTERAHRLGAVLQQRALERRIAPGLGHHARARVGTDLGLEGFDDEIERGRIDIALLRQNGFQRAYAQLGFRELRAVLIVIVFGHGRNLECIVPWGG